VSQYDVLRDFVDNLGEGFIELGYKIVILDFNSSEEGYQQLISLDKRKILFIFDYNMISMSLFNSIDYFQHIEDIPIISSLVDNPMYHVKRLKIAKENHLVTYVDKNYPRLLKDICPEKKISLWYHTGTSIDSPIVRMKEREIDILIGGSYSC